MLLSSFLILLSLSAAPAFSLSVVTGSPCYTACNGDSTTHFTDLVCNDGDYNTTVSGQQMQQCLTCESTSLFTNETDSDEYWLLFNMKFTSQVCLFDTTSKTPQVAACASTCGPLQPVLDTLWLSTIPKANQYDYCSINSAAFPASAAECASCLQGQEGSLVLGNFISTLSTACTNQPLAVEGQLVIPPKSLFDTSTFTNTSTASSSSVTSTNSTLTGSRAATSRTSKSTTPSRHQLISTTTSKTSSSSNNSPTANFASGDDSSSSESQSRRLSTGDTIGFTILSTVIALLAVCLMAALLAFCFVRRRRHRKRTMFHWRKASVGDITPPGTSSSSKDEKKPRVDSVSASVADRKLRPSPSRVGDMTLRYYPSVSECGSEVPPTPTTLTPTPLPTPTIRRLSIRHAVDSSPPMTMMGQSLSSFPADTTIVESPDNSEVTLPPTVYTRTTRPPSRKTPFWSSGLGPQVRDRSFQRRQPSSPGSPPPPKARRIADVAPPLPRVNSRGFIQTPGQGLHVKPLEVGRMAPVVQVERGRRRTRERSVSAFSGIPAGWKDPGLVQKGNRNSNWETYPTDSRESWGGRSTPVSIFSEAERG